MELYRLGIGDSREMIDSGGVTPGMLVESFLKRIEETEKDVHAFVTVTGDSALEKASISGSAGGGVLAGIPVAVKDNICTKGVKTTCSSAILSNFVPPYESTATSRLESGGYILIGKTNLDEFAMGSSTENSVIGPTRNPWDTRRVPGGSSGGSAAAVAADQCAAAIGSDTGGSIRQPAAFCGVVGLKPTYGRVSRYGLVAFASSLDQIGPLTKNVRDAALILNVIAGHDPLDSTSAVVDKPDFAALLGQDIKGMKIGIPEEYFIEGIDPEVKEAVKKSIAVMESLGAEPVEITLPHTGYAVASYYILATSEASSNLARYDGVKYGIRSRGEDLIETYMKTRQEGFGAEVKRRIILGTYSLSSGYYDAYYRKAQQIRTLIVNDFRSALESVDLVLTPTTPAPAFRIGEKTEDPLQMYLTDIFTISANLAGVPAISVPCGFTKAGLPVGLQLIGKHFDEVTVLRAAYAYEQATEWHLKKSRDKGPGPRD